MNVVILILSTIMATSVEVVECYICFQAECEEGEKCVKACDFCRGSNVHVSCLLRAHPVDGDITKCPTCRQELGAKFKIEK